MGYSEPGSESVEPMRRSKQAERRSSEAGGKSALPVSGIVAIMAEDAYLVVQPSLEKATMDHETCVTARCHCLTDAGTKDIIEICNPG